MTWMVYALGAIGAVALIVVAGLGITLSLMLFAESRARRKVTPHEWLTTRDLSGRS